MRFLYFAVSMPVLFMSLVVLMFIPRLRCEYRRVKAKVIVHPQTPFENMLTVLLVLAEDHRYMTHFGFDPIAIARAIFRFFVERRTEGASTIEQQLVRTVTKKYELTLRRKIEEIIVSSVVSISNDKKDIAHTYLSLAYFGCDLVGYRSASEMLVIEGELNDCEVKHGAAIVALLKRPRPAGRNESWSALYRLRLDHIVVKYIKLKGAGLVKGTR